MKEKRILRLGSLRFDWSAAEPWRAMLPVDQLTLAAKFQLKLKGHRALLLASTVSALMPLVSDNVPAGAVAQAAAGGWRQLSRGILRDDRIACQVGAANLAGLGQGLTPAGDDFMMGVMYSVWTTKPPEVARALAAAMAAGARSRTNILAAAWLCSAAEGEVGQHWLALFNSAAADQLSMPDFAPILSTGASSGADALAGFVAGLQLLLAGN